MKPVVVIGGGINGLTCAAYLAKAGLKPIILEATDRVVSPPGVHDVLRMRSAAFLPGAPMMPPPGCVAEPHM